MNDDDVLTQEWRTRPARRWPWVLVAAVAAFLVVGGVWVHRGGDSATVGPAGSAGVAVGSVRPAYDGRYVTAQEVAALQAQGLATKAALTRELVCQGVELYFDTSAERDAYLSDYAARYPVQPAYVDANPCLPYAGSPRYVDQG